jgi:hypothetical protein
METFGILCVKRSTHTTREMGDGGFYTVGCVMLRANKREQASCEVEVRE